MSKAKVQPLGGRVLIKLDDKVESRPSGELYFPDASKEKPQTGIVIAIGDDDEEIKVKIGQKVLFPKHIGTDIKLDGVDHLIMDAGDILAVINQ